MSIDRHAVQDLVYQSCILLDATRYDEWLELLAPDFRYRVVAYSEEIRKEMVWLDHDSAELKGLFKNLSSHVRVLGTYRRQVGVFEEVDRNGDTIEINSSVVIYHTTPVGRSKLFALAHYNDVAVTNGEAPRLQRRTVRLETRQLDFGPHVII